MQRQEGWYHVKFKGSWVCAFWCNPENEWHYLGCSVSEDEFESVGQRIPSPDEQWVCVPEKELEEVLSELYSDSTPISREQAGNRLEEALYR